jgi:hypothetical protein
MPTQQELSVKDAVTHAIDDMAKAISERPGDGNQDQSIRARVATMMIEEFNPRNVVQVILAGHCVMFHAVMTASIRDTLRGDLETMRHATRSNIVAMNKSFHMNLDRLDRYRIRAAASQASAPAAAVPPPEDKMQPEPSESPETEAPQITPAPTPEAPRSRVPIGAAQPQLRRPRQAASAQYAGKPANGNGPVATEPGKTVTPPPSASVASPT